MSIFKRATNQQAYLKMGLLGFQGSGKTYTAVSVALGLHRHIECVAPVFFCDSETGSDWALPRCAAAGVEMQVVKSRAFSDLQAGVVEAERAGGILIVDSITHYWRELVDTYCRQNNIRGRIAFHHWGPIKELWHQFSTAFVNSSLHILVCGRAGWEYEYVPDDKGKDELQKSGTKMRVEAEFGYEPSLVVEMERFRESPEIGAPVVHVAHVIKDRRMDERTLDGKSFRNPVFENFLPHIDALNLGGEHLGVDANRTSAAAIPLEGGGESGRRTQQTIALEELEETCKILWPSTSGKDKQMKVRAIERVLGTRSWTAVQRMGLEELDVAVARLRALEARDGVDVHDTEAVFAILDAAKPAALDTTAPWGGIPLVPAPVASDGDVGGPGEPDTSEVSDEEVKDL